MNDPTINRVTKYLHDLYQDGDMALAGDSNDAEHDALYAIVEGIANCLELLGSPIGEDEDDE